MVVGVPHCPSGGVSLGVFVVGSVDQSAMAVGPFRKCVELVDSGYRAVVDVPVGRRGVRVDPARHARGRRGMPGRENAWVDFCQREINCLCQELLQIWV